MIRAYIRYIYVHTIRRNELVYMYQKTGLFDNRNPYLRGHRVSVATQKKYRDLVMVLKFATVERGENKAGDGRTGRGWATALLSRASDCLALGIESTPCCSSLFFFLAFSCMDPRLPTCLACLPACLRCVSPTSCATIAWCARSSRSLFCVILLSPRSVAHREKGGSCITRMQYMTGLP